MKNNIHDIRYQEKDINAEFTSIQMLLYFPCLVRIMELFREYLRKDDLKMSQQRNLLESMIWRINAVPESGLTRSSVTESVGVAKSVISGT